MKKYEYKVVDVDANKEEYPDGHQHDRELEKVLNIWGEEGWELDNIFWCYRRDILGGDHFMVVLRK